jgi:hypothetical protein
MNPQALLEKLPLVRSWIDRTLAEHSQKARPVASYRFPRLDAFYSNQVLSAAKVIEVERVPVPPLSSFGLAGFGEFEGGNYAGITFLDSYFVQSREASRESLHFHELVHVVQWQHLGAERFLMAYAIGYLQGGGYSANPLEVMAYNLQDYFEKGGQPSDVEAAVHRQLDEFIPTLERAFK